MHLSYTVHPIFKYLQYNILTSSYALVTIIGLYPGIGGNREYIAGLVIFPHHQTTPIKKFVTHHLHKKEAVRVSKDNEL